jgi:Trypsin-like peptidase domain
MTGPRPRLRWVVAFTAALLVSGTGPAGAHEHPTPTERAAPGVVYVEAGADVEVSLVEHLQSDPGGVHIRIIQSTAQPVLASASGFVVDPTGSVVTSGAITAFDSDKAAVYAINQAFQARYGNEAPLTGDLFTRQVIGDPATNRLQQRLEACYPPHTTNDAGGCVVRVTPTYTVYPYVSSQEEYGQLEAELSPASTSDVALLRVRGASGMPTVDLGETTEGASALAVLGFEGIPGAQYQQRTINAHLAEPGGTVFKTEDLDEKETTASIDLAAGLTAGMRGGPLVAESGRVVGFAVPEADSGPPPAAPGRLVDAGAIREVLDTAGVTPRQGPVDASFERASHAFKNGGFAAAIPNLEDTLELFPGHALAAANLAEAQTNVAAGTPGAAPPAEGPSAATANGAGFPWTVVLSAVAAVLVLAAVALIVLRRRRTASGPGGAVRGGTPSPGPLKPGTGRPGTAKPGTVKSRETRPRDGTPGSPSRSATGLRERPKVPSGVTGTGAVSVIEGRGASPGAGPSTSVPEQRAPDAAGDGSRSASQALMASSAEDSQAFCTDCGAALGPHHKFCGRCGRPTG